MSSAGYKRKNEGTGFPAPSQRLPKVDDGGYFFFEDFFAAFFAAFFLAAIQLTTFHAVRDLPVALTWQDVSDRSGKSISKFRREMGRRPSTSTERLIEYLEVIVFLACKYAI
ncbi:MAG TPA: hypothetical protein VG323_18075 [Thermoanaerobaculia bacterium]|nr:hypothetical protein [Thermoanaerobaculia bacterium]